VTSPVRLSWWKKFLRPRPYSPVWQRMRGAKLMWVTSRFTPGISRLARLVFLCHELVAWHPYVRFELRELAHKSDASTHEVAETAPPV
jgi:hypothetical protein